MYRNAAVAGSTSSDNIQSSGKTPKDTILSRCTELLTPSPTQNVKTKLWKPTALRVPVLLLTISICWALVALLEYLLWKSQRDNGLIFAPVINDLPLGDTFLYLYFPTIIAVVFSIYWAWIDLETKRMEPYYQLSKENGALGKDSLLLQYPFSFIPLAPIRAFRDKHWPVFWASFAVVLVTWGLVPTQAGIFSVRTVTRTTNTTFVTSTSSMPFDTQANSLSFRYSQSTYGIATLNETLPPYMTHNYTLAPFEPLDSTDSGLEGHGTYTAPTTMYTLDLVCEDVSHKSDNSRMIFYTSSTGCNTTSGLNGNTTISPKDESKTEANKGYSTRYMGYHNGGYADWYLSPDCPKSANTTFYAAIAKTKAREEDPPQDVTAIFCHPQYWRQDVFATVDRQTREPLRVEPLGDKQTLSWDILNTTNFEALLNSGYLGVKIRGDSLPTLNIPNYLEIIASTDLSIVAGTQPMVGLALATSKRPLSDYLDWRVLSEAYATAYRLLFARAMVDILGTETRTSKEAFRTSKEAVGQQQVISEAVVLEPVFVHIVVGFLVVVSIATIALLVLSLTRKRNLRTDPSTIASIMAIVADDQMLLSDFADLDCCTEEDIQKVLSQKRYKLIIDDHGTRILDISDTIVLNSENDIIGRLGQRRDSPTSIAKPVRPIEFSLWMAFPLVSLFVALAVVLGIIFAKARAKGLPVPSSNVIVQNILENYIPTAIATLIEPMWILINRLLCMLQPLQELQDCNAKAKKSIDMDYSSLPPQLVVIKALRSKHFVLAAVCTMALLANLLAVAFSGLFNQELYDIQYATTLQPPYQYKIVPINGSVGPGGSTFGGSEASGAYRVGTGEDQFLVAESNLTRKTPLPSWTDDSMFYFPVFDESASSGPKPGYFEATTQTLGAELDCTELKIGDNFQASMTNGSSSTAIDMSLIIPDNAGNVNCTASGNILAGTTIAGPMGYEYGCVTGPTANEIVYNLNPQVNATQHERDVCMGRVVFAWMRYPEGTCPAGKKMKLNEATTLFVHCRPRIVTGSAQIQVDASGRLQRPVESVTKKTNQNAPDDLFSNDIINIVGQSNLYIFQANGGDFHNDSFADNKFTYFVKHAANGSRLIEPNTPVPTFSEVVAPLNNAYSKLFAIWLGINKKNLFLPASPELAAPINAYRVQPEQRIFLSQTMFIISEAILCTYVLVAIWVYMRRPGQYLARMPTSIAAVMALFAASAAVQDMKGTSHLNRKGRAQHLERLNSRYGFGSFVGGDGRVHIGIEKVPLVVKPRASTTWLEQKVPLLRKRSGGLS